MGRAMARARAGTRYWLPLRAINRASSNKYFPCVERHPESDNRYDKTPFRNGHFDTDF